MRDSLPTDAATNERLRALFEQAPSFVAILRGPTHLIEFANAAFYGLVGEREIVGLPVAVGLPESTEQGFVALLDRVYATGEPFVGRGVPYQAHRVAGSPPEETFVDFVYQPVREVDGSVSGIFVQGHDVTAAVRALAAESAGRAQAEGLLAEINALYRASPLALASVVPDAEGGGYRYARVNEAHASMHGLSPEALSGRTLGDMLAPALHTRVQGILDAVSETGEAATGLLFSGALASETGTTRHWRSSFYPIVSDSGEVVSIGVAAQDVTEDLRIKEDLQVRASASAFRAALADALRPLVDPGAIQAEAARVLADHLGADRVHYVDVDADTVGAEVAYEYCAGLPSMKGRYQLDDFGASLIDEIRAGRAQVVSDVACDPRLNDAERGAFEAVSIAAHVSMPLVKDGRLAFILGVYQTTPRAWRPDEVTLIEETAERTWSAAERARAEAALRDREARYHALFSAIDEGYCLCEIVVDETGTAVDYRFLEVNPQFEAMTGLADVVGRTVYEMVPTFERQWIDTYARVALGGESLRLQDGSEALGRWFDVFAMPVAPRGRFAVVFKDITARKAAEDALHESEARLRIALEGGRMGVWEWDIPTETVTADARFRALWGFGASETLSAPEIFARMLPGDVQRVQALVAQAPSAGGVYHAEFPITWPDGTVRWLAGPGRVQQGPDGQIVRVTGVNFDITEQKQAERDLREGEARLRMALEGGKMGVWEWEMATGAVTTDARLRELWCLGAEEVVHIDEVFARIHPDDIDPVRERLAGAFAGGGAYDSEFRIVHPDGTVRWIAGPGRVVLGADGQPARLTGVNFDITEQKQAEEDLRAREADLRTLAGSLEVRVAERTADLEAANRLLEIRNRELQDFAYVASHDLQEPLRKVQSFAGLLATEYADALGTEGRFYVERTQSAAARMSGLIRDLLAFSRIATSRNPSETVDLDATLAAVLSDLEVRIEQTGGRVEAAFLGTVRADPMQMRQLLQNLVGNALKFHRPGTPPVVRVWTEKGSGGALRIGVEDNGVGFDGKHAERIFAPFQRLHAKHEYDGTGMGLAIVRRIAERHGGTVKAESTPGEGSRFVVTLGGGGDAR